MKRFKTIMAGLLLVFSTQAFAAQWALQLGANMAEFDLDEGDGEFDPGVGLQVGGLYYTDLTETVQLRTGAILSQRKASAEINGNDYDYDFWHIDVPVTAQYMFNDMWGVFGGLDLSLRLNEDTRLNNADVDIEPEDFFAAANIGGHMAFAENQGVDVFFNLGLNEIAADTTTTNFGAAYVYKF